MTHPSPQFSLGEDGRFTITAYNWAKPFSNFFPGIAGKWGIPMWVYYVSRNQGLISLGVHDKDHAIMPFLSFSKALQSVGGQGFRTFIRDAGGVIYEPFKKHSDAALEQSMTVSSHELELHERNPGLGLEFSVIYYPLPEMPVAGVVRQVSIKNLRSEVRQLDVVDGLPKILPYGVTFEHMNVIARHIEGMMGVFDVDGMPVYRLKQTPSDTEEIGEIRGGNYYMTISEKGESLSGNILVDPAVVFGEAEVHDYPWGLERVGVEQLLGMAQVRENRTPSALTALSLELAAGQSTAFSSIIGYAQTDDALRALAGLAGQPGFFADKRDQNQQVVDGVKHTAFSLSGEPAFDQYVQQTFLDNVMRGGMPVRFGDGDQGKTFYIYARQNGDLERDYHWFVLEPTYLSQGNGHYRSILQNRRMDGWFFPEIGDHNLLTYLNLIQTDGYNPLVVNGESYTAADGPAVQAWLQANVTAGGVETLLELVTGSFTPGAFIGALESLGSPIDRPYEALLGELLALCRAEEVGALHEGYWQDHWFYNLDTIETYRMVYPDRWQHSLLEGRRYSWFDNPDVVQPRAVKTVLVGDKVRQYGAVVRDAEKMAQIESRSHERYKMRTEFGAGEVYRSSLLSKLLCIIANRIASLDRTGLGVEMEAGKPGWLDSLNGLPGLFGSSLNETFELQRACGMLLDSLPRGSDSTHPLFNELAEFIRELDLAIKARLDSDDALMFWDKSQSLKEAYRAATRLGIAGAETDVPTTEIAGFLEGCLAIIDAALEQGPVLDANGLPVTYYVTELTEYQSPDPASASEGPIRVQPLAFEQRSMAPFLEGPVHYLRMRPQEGARTHAAVRASELYDQELKMYRCCAWLKDEPFEIGRIKSYARGWIENESIYTHMEYKWLLEVLRAGLYDQFFEDIGQALPPFLDPARYGRSPLEGSSFIASSVYPDTQSHGRAFQPRLSGVTCEMLNIWALMVAGDRPFSVDANDELYLRLNPILHPRFFTHAPTMAEYIGSEGVQQRIDVPENSFAFVFLGHTPVVYINPSRAPTYGPNGVSPGAYTLTLSDGSVETVEANSLRGAQANAVRTGGIARLDIRLE